NFKNSDGKLSSNLPIPPEQRYQLRSVKAKILEIIWCYLYSGREQQAWHSLADMWPARDIDRIRSVITSIWSHGIRAQVDGASRSPASNKKRAPIFSAGIESAGGVREVTPPQPIMLRRPPIAGIPTQNSSSELLLELVIDSAGKVRSAQPVGKSSID